MIKIILLLFLFNTVYGYQVSHTILKEIKKTSKLVFAVKPSTQFSFKDLKIDERHKALLKNARPLNREKTFFELIGNGKNESFNDKEFSLVTKKKPFFLNYVIEKYKKFSFLNFFFDGRSKIKDSLSFPFLPISNIEGEEYIGKNKMYLWRGSGFLIGPRVLITAKHCVEPQTKDGKVYIKAYFGKTNDLILFSAKSLSVYKHPSRDVAMVLLDSEVGLKTGSLKMSKDIKKTNIVSIIGYPGVKTLMSYFVHFGETEMYGMSGVLLTKEQNNLTYNIDTSEGQSGGPVSNILIDNTTEDEDVEVFGVHTTGGVDYNIGESYDADMENFISDGEKSFIEFLDENE